jgi:hypothetical protein
VVLYACRRHAYPDYSVTAIISFLWLCDMGETTIVQYACRYPHLFLSENEDIGTDDTTMMTMMNISRICNQLKWITLIVIALLVLLAYRVRPSDKAIAAAAVAKATATAAHTKNKPE